MSDSPGPDGAGEHDLDALLEGRQLKRKKTVTWADDEFELPLAALPDAADGLAGGGAGSCAPRPSREADVAVLVLPCDGLFDTVTAAMLQGQVDTPPPSEEPLSRRQLLERRLAAVDRLSGIYEGELWQLFEELRLRHAQFTALPGASVWKHGGRSNACADAADDVEMADASVAAGKATGDCPPEGTPGALRELWQQRQAARQAGAAAAAAPAERQAGEQEAADSRAASAQQQQQDQQVIHKEKPQDGQQQAGAPPPPLPQFEDVEALLLSEAGAALPSPDPDALVEARKGFVRHLALVGRLEQGALGALCRELDALGGLALLAGRRARFILRRAAVALGRCTESRGKVDVDLALEAPEGGAAQRVSRQQAQLWMEPDGGWRLRCTGRRALLINGATVSRGQTAALPSLSHIQAGGVSLLFVANSAAAARAAARSAQPAA